MTSPGCWGTDGSVEADGLQDEVLLRLKLEGLLPKEAESVGKQLASEQLILADDVR